MVASFTVPSDLEGPGRWREVHAKSDKGPSSRYGHSAVIHDRKVRKKHKAIEIFQPAKCRFVIRRI